MEEVRRRGRPKKYTTNFIVMKNIRFDLVNEDDGILVKRGEQELAKVKNKAEAEGFCHKFCWGSKRH